MAERDLSKRVMKLLRGRHPQRIESSCTPGCPDIAFIGGWVELKWIRSWPKSGVVKVHHWTNTQRAWHIAHWAAGGKSWVILQVEKHYMACPGNVFSGQWQKIGNCKPWDLEDQVAYILDYGI